MTAFLGGQGLTVTSVSIKGKGIKDKRVPWRQAVKHEEPQWTEFKQEFTCRPESLQAGDHFTSAPVTSIICHAASLKYTMSKD